MVEKETGKIIYQITSSPITNIPAYFLDLFMAKYSCNFCFHLDKDHNRTVYGNITRRYRNRNFAVIKIKFVEHNPKVDLYMYEQGKSTPDKIAIC